MKWGWLLLIALVGCSTPRADKRTPPMPPVQPKASRASTPRMALAQAPKTLWLVWGPKTWVEMEWDRNPETNVLGYILRRGSAPRIYDVQFNAGNETSVRCDVLPSTRYYFAVAAYDLSGLESGLSKEVSYVTPATPPLHARLTPAAPVTSPAGQFEIEAKDLIGFPTWTHFASVTNAFLQITATETRFFRVLKK